VWHETCFYRPAFHPKYQCYQQRSARNHLAPTIWRDHGSAFFIQSV
jgi:hypothetical protein